MRAHPTSSVPSLFRFLTLPGLLRNKLPSSSGQDACRLPKPRAPVLRRNQPRPLAGKASQNSPTLAHPTGQAPTRSPCNHQASPPPPPARRPGVRLTGQAKLKGRTIRFLSLVRVYFKWKVFPPSTGVEPAPKLQGPPAETRD